MSEVKTGEEIFFEIDKEFDEGTWDLNDDFVQHYREITVNHLKRMVLVPEEKWHEQEVIIELLRLEIKAREEERERIKTLIKNEPRFSDHLFGENDYKTELEAKTNYILALHPWLSELRGLIKDD